MEKISGRHLHILLADDHNLFREAMAEWLKRLSESVIIHHTNSLNGTLKLLQSQAVLSLVMVDLHMPDMNGISSLIKICKQADSTPTVVVSADESPITISRCLSTDISGYILKSYDGDVVLSAIETILNGQRYIPAGIALKGQKKWSDKQLKLLACLSQGMSNREIARKIYLSEGTVKQYVSHILSELDVSNRTQAGIKAKEILGC